eukprot:g8345.t1
MSSSLSSYEQKIMREKMTQKIRNETMGDVMFQHLKESFGSDLKVKENDVDNAKKDTFEKVKKVKKKVGNNKKVSNLKENQPRNNVKNNINSNNNAGKPVATFTTKDGKKGTLTAAEFMKLQKAYQKYKIENTPRSFNRNAPAGTDYKKWDQFVNELDKEEEKTKKIESRKKKLEQQKEAALLRQNNIENSSKEFGTKLKILTVVVSFVITFGISFMMDIRSTFIKQVIFAIVAIIIFFALLYDQTNGYGWYSKVPNVVKKDI